MYYGDPVIRELVDRGLYQGVYVLYLDPAQANTRTERKQKYQRVARKLNSIEPTTIYISRMDSDIIDYLDNSVRDRVVIIENSWSSRAKRQATKITSFLVRSDIDVKKIYILQDSSTFSETTTSYLKQALDSHKRIPNLKIEIISIKNFQDIRLTFNRIDKEQEVVIINNLRTLLDVELNKYKDADDIKHELVTYNHRHLDIGFKRALENEAVVIEEHPADLYKIFAEDAPKDTYIRTRVFVNPERIRTLKQDIIITNYFYQIDGLIK